MVNRTRDVVQRNHQRILDLLASEDGVNLDDLTTRTGLKRMSIYLRMKKLVDNGIAEVINKDAYASNNNTPYLYRLRATTSTLRNKGQP